MSFMKVYGQGATKLKDIHIVIVGLGGLGCNVANLLARMKANLVLVDNDIVDDTNLERQTLYDIKDLLICKVDAARHKLEQFTSISTFNEYLNIENISKLGRPDLIIDCTDNVESRLLINDYCLKHSIPWIYSGAVSNIGIIYLINDSNKACYQCINQLKQGNTSCEIGVMNTIVSTVAAITVNLALDFLIKELAEPCIFRISGNNIIRLHPKKNPSCNACNGRYDYLKYEI